MVDLVIGFMANIEQTNKCALWVEITNIAHADFVESVTSIARSIWFIKRISQSEFK